MTNMIDNCIGANLVLLEMRLREAAVTAGYARDAMRNGQRNLVIGTLLPLERELQIATALRQTILTLHQMPADTANQTAGNGGVR